MEVLVFLLFAFHSYIDFLDCWRCSWVEHACSTSYYRPLIRLEYISDTGESRNS